MNQNSKIILPDSYFLPRDFEIVQPIYDLAFLLKINGSQTESSVPKYRVYSLNSAAHSLDGYSAATTKWLIGSLNDADLDYVPSARIKELLTSIKDSGTIPELQELMSPEAEGCLRLRSIRGLGIKFVSEFLRNGLTPSHELLTAATRRCGLPQDEILGIFQGRSPRQWESPHIVPPLLRFLKCVEKRSGKKLKWQIIGIEDGISPVKGYFKVHMM